MRNLLPYLSVLAVLLGACSPAQYKVNPPNPEDDPAEEDNLALNDPVLEEMVSESEIPEAQREGYMRIVGDLRWDQLTSRSEWTNRIPCLTKTITISKNFYYVVADDDSKCLENIGGIEMAPKSVYFGMSSGTESGEMATYVYFGFASVADKRSFSAVIQQKYDLKTNKDFDELYCSKYTCWDLDANVAKPTPYTISILDNKKVDTSEF